MMEQQLQGDAHMSVEVLAQSLSRRGYVVKVRRAMGGGPGASCLRQLRHVFLSALSPGTQGSRAGSTPERMCNAGGSDCEDFDAV